jgi:hypothetical protein
MTRVEIFGDKKHENYSKSPLLLDFFPHTAISRARGPFRFQVKGRRKSKLGYPIVYYSNTSEDILETLLFYFYLAYYSQF